MGTLDKRLICRDCSNDFVFSAGEQDFYIMKGLQHEPHRCPDCRSLRRQGRTPGAARALFTSLCSSCGQEARVPFSPRAGKPVYCRSCFEAVRIATTVPPVMAH